MIRSLPIREIGAAKAMRKIHTGGRDFFRNEEIPLDMLKNFKQANLDSMVEHGQVQVWPKSVTFLRPPQAAAPAVTNDDEESDDEEDDAKLHVVPKGFGRYDVIKGVVLATSVSRDEAHAIAGTPKPEAAASAPPTVRTKRKVHRRAKPKSRSHATAPEPQMPHGVKPSDDEPNGPVE